MDDKTRFLLDSLLLIEQTQGNVEDEFEFGRHLYRSLCYIVQADSWLWDIEHQLELLALLRRYSNKFRAPVRPIQSAAEMTQLWEEEIIHARQSELTESTNSGPLTAESAPRPMQSAAEMMQLWEEEIIHARQSEFIESDNTPFRLESAPRLMQGAAETTQLWEEQVEFTESSSSGGLSAHSTPDYYSTPNKGISDHELQQFRREVIDLLRKRR
jgi:hypothetical protein